MRHIAIPSVSRDLVAQCPSRRTRSLDRLGVTAGVGMTTVAQAREIARRWVEDEVDDLPGVRGAFLHGSTTWLGGDAVIPAASDVDVVVVADASIPTERRGKTRAGGVILDVSSLRTADLGSADQVLGRYHLASSFRTPSVVFDRDGWLTDLNAAVARGFARRRWVERRVDHAAERVRSNLRAMESAAPFHELVTAWLFAAGVTTHVLLVAGLRNPTVRTRYVAVRALLAEYGMEEEYETLLGLIGCANWTREQAHNHLDGLTGAFDAAKDLIRTPFFFASDISDLACPIAIGGSRDLIDRGLHREAVFWLVATWSRCMAVFAHDAPPVVLDRFEPGYRRLLADLGIASEGDLRRGGMEIAAALPHVQVAADAILDANPQIDDEGRPQRG